MNSNQTECILKNLTYLIKHTCCTDTLLSAFLQNGTFAEEDAENIRGPNATQYQKAYTFYGILMTRQVSFCDLRQIFIDNKQYPVAEVFHEFRRKYGIDDESIRVEEKKYLGKKAWTKVYEGQMVYRTNVAVRRTKITDEEIDDLTWETSILETLPCHSNIVQFYDAAIRRDCFLIAFEKCTLSLHALATERHTENKLGFDPIDVLRQAATGLCFLHQNDIIHGNLKPTKILVTFKSHCYSLVKISDFRKSKRLGAVQSLTVKYTPEEISLADSQWISPEVLDAAFKKTAIVMTKGMDICSLGCIIKFVLRGGKFEFLNLATQNSPVKPEELLGDRREEASELITLMVSKDACKRPSAHEVIKHRYLYQ